MPVIKKLISLTKIARTIKDTFEADSYQTTSMGKEKKKTQPQINLCPVLPTGLINTAFSCFFSSV